MQVWQQTLMSIVGVLLSTPPKPQLVTTLPRDVKQHQLLCPKSHIRHATRIISDDNMEDQSSSLPCKKPITVNNPQTSILPKAFTSPAKTFLYTPHTPKTPVYRVLCPVVTQLISKPDNQTGAVCLMQAKDKADYKKRIIYHHAWLLMILRALNSNELEMLYSNSLLMFFARLDKNEKRKLKGAFDNT